jgi:uncharacterized protein DUF4352
MAAADEPSLQSRPIQLALVAGRERRLTKLIRDLVRPLILLVALALVAGGCGGSTKHEAKATVQSSSSDCAFKGITAGPRREGTCVARGVAITVADRAHWLHGKDYDARVLGMRTASKLRAGASGTIHPHGRFVIVSLSVKNTLDSAHEFDRRSDLVFLFVDGKYFSERADAENDPALAPFRLRTTAVQPDETATGTVVFDVPAQHAKHLSAAGSDLILVNYSDEAKGFPTGKQQLQTLGYIRLWK